MPETQMLQLILTAVAALALVLQTIFVIAALVVIRRTARSVREEMEDYRSSIMPIIEKTRSVVQNIAPRLEESAKNLTEISKSLRAQTAVIQSATDEIADRVRHQASRVDSMMTAVLDRVERAGTTVSDVVSKSLRQLSGLTASLKAAVEAMREPGSGKPRAAQGSPSRYQESEPFTNPRPTGPPSPFRS